MDSIKVRFYMEEVRNTIKKLAIINALKYGGSAQEKTEIMVMEGL